MGLFNLKPTTEQLIYEKTCQDEFEKFAINISSEAKPTASGGTEHPFPNFPMNRLVYSLTYNEKIDELAKEYHSDGGGMHKGYVNIGFQNYIDVSKIGDHTFTFKEAMDLIRSVREQVGPDMFYGAVLSNKKHVDVNPLHPLVLNEFMRMNEKQLKANGLKNYSVIFYTFKDTISRLKERYPEKFEINGRFTSDILNLVLGTKFKQETFSVMSNPELHQENNKFFIKYQEKIIDAKGHDVIMNQDTKNDVYKQSYVVPGQILNLRGITYPYYGAIYIKGGRAWNLSPMLSTNVDSPLDTKQDYKYGSAICTKVGDARTAVGCMTLNHSNTTSQRNEQTLRDGSIGYAKVAVDVALSMFFTDYTGTIQLKPEDKKMTLNEFLKAEPTKTKRDYLKYIRERITERMEK